MENFKQELQVLLAKYPDVESISFKVTETITRTTPQSGMSAILLNVTGPGSTIVSTAEPKKKEEKPLSPLEKVITPEMLAKIKASSSIE